MRHRLVALPIDGLLTEVTTSLKDAPALVLRSPTGSGKTTRVPPALERAGLGMILLVEPRRVAARGAARRMAFEKGEKVGASVGYHVRFDQCVSSATNILAMTEGIFLRRVLADPFLEGVGCVIFDEFHERHLDGDLGLALARRVQLEAREDLKIVVLSATVDPDPLVAFLDAKVIDAPGQLFPIEVERQPALGRESLEGQVVRAVSRASAWIEECHQQPGSKQPKPGRDMLVFLPGKAEIRRAKEALDRKGIKSEALHGELDAKGQDRILGASSQADIGRVILSTNIAESSVTIEGLGVVIDSGQARVMRLDNQVGLNRLELTQIPMPSVLQRMGRAGRCGPGLNLRLWSAAAERTFAASVEPEISRVDLASALLALADFGERSPIDFDWFERPPEASSNLALGLLRSIGALCDTGITAEGRELARLPLHPRLGQLLMAGRRHGVLERAAMGAALLSERDVLGRMLVALEPERVHDSDLLERLEVIEDQSQVRAPRHFILEIQRVRDQLLRLIDRDDSVNAPDDPDEALLQALFEAFPDRVAVLQKSPDDARTTPRRVSRSPGRGADLVRARMVGGHGLVLGDECRVREAEIFVALEVGGRARGSNEAFVRQASRVKRAWLEQLAPIDEELVCEVDETNGRVRPKRVRSWRGLVLSERPVSDVNRAELALVREAALVRFSRRRPTEVFDLSGADCLQLEARVSFARERIGADGTCVPPPFDAQQYALQHLSELVVGAKTLGDLRALNVASLYLLNLDYHQRQKLDQVAPLALKLPNGEGASVRYESERGPVLSVRIQQLFGWQETPEVGGFSVLLELCAPNGRPQQVTRDLAGFWAGSYALVRKDLRGRYPKHPWPEQPASASPVPPFRRRR